MFPSRDLSAGFFHNKFLHPQRRQEHPAEVSDVFLKIQVAPDPRFERKGDHLYTEVSADLFTAILGGEVKVPTLSGSVSLSIPAGTQPGQRFRLKGKGMPNLKEKNKRGDLFATVRVALPKDLTNEQRQLYEQLARLK